MSAETLSLPNLEMHEQLDFLITYGLSEQHRINELDLTPEEKLQAMQQLVHDLDQDNPCTDRPVHIQGDRVFDVPVMDAALTADDLKDANDNGFVSQNTIGPDEVSGFNFGFAAKEIQVEIDGFDFGSRYVLCHMVRTGQTVAQINKAGNLTTEEVINYFAVESSVLKFEDDFYAHDLRELRASEDELYKDLDDVIYDESFSLGDKLAALQEVLADHGFPDLESEYQTQVVSYLNSCRLFKPLQAFIARYAINMAPEQNAQMVILDMEQYTDAAFSHFRLVRQFDIEPVANSDAVQWLASHAGMGVGIQADLFSEEDRHPVILPLNQLIRIDNDTSEEPVAREVA